MGDWCWLFRKLCDLFWKLLKYLGIKWRVKRKCLRTDKIPKKIVAAYFLSGSTRSAEVLSQINPRLLTHLYYAFLEVQVDGTLKVKNEKLIKELDIATKLIQLKKGNPNLKMLFSCVSKNNSFSIVVNSQEKRTVFVQSAVVTIKLWSFDGLDIDWEFPKAKDKENFLKLLRELREEFNKYNFLLTAAVRAIPIYGGSGYDVEEISKILDLINIMTYDYYGGWSSHTGFNSPLYPSSKDTEYERKYLNIESSIKNWVNAGAAKKKICIGIPFYGRSFTLRNESETDLHAPTMGPGRVASPTYYDIAKKYTTWKTQRDDEQMGVYKYNDNQWIGYDDRDTIKMKVNFAIQEDIAGIFIWQLAGDDITGEVSGGIRQYLLYSIYKQMIKDNIQHMVAPRIKRSIKPDPAPESLLSPDRITDLVVSGSADPSALTLDEPGPSGVEPRTKTALESKKEVKPVESEQKPNMNRAELDAATLETPIDKTESNSIETDSEQEIEDSDVQENEAVSNSSDEDSSSTLVTSP